MTVPLSLLESVEGEFVCNIVLDNTDNGKKSGSDVLSASDISRYNTWCKVRLAK